jgi:hypothetical protein
MKIVKNLLAQVYAFKDMITGRLTLEMLASLDSGNAIIYHF